MSDEIDKILQSNYFKVDEVIKTMRELSIDEKDYSRYLVDHKTSSTSDYVIPVRTTRRSQDRNHVQESIQPYCKDTRRARTPRRPKYEYQDQPKPPPPYNSHQTAYQEHSSTNNCVSNPIQSVPYLPPYEHSLNNHCLSNLFQPMPHLQTSQNSSTNNFLLPSMSSSPASEHPNFANKPIQVVSCLPKSEYSNNDHFINSRPQSVSYLPPSKQLFPSNNNHFGNNPLQSGCYSPASEHSSIKHFVNNPFQSVSGLPTSKHSSTNNTNSHFFNDPHQSVSYLPASEHSYINHFVNRPLQSVSCIPASIPPPTNTKNHFVNNPHQSVSYLPASEHSCLNHFVNRPIQSVSCLSASIPSSTNTNNQFVNNPLQPLSYLPAYNNNSSTNHFINNSVQSVPGLPTSKHSDTITGNLFFNSPLQSVSYLPASDHSSTNHFVNNLLQPPNNFPPSYHQTHSFRETIPNETPSKHLFQETQKNLLHMTASVSQSVNLQVTNCNSNANMLTSSMNESFNGKLAQGINYPISTAKRIVQCPPLYQNFPTPSPQGSYGTLLHNQTSQFPIPTLQSSKVEVNRSCSYGPAQLQSRKASSHQNLQFQSNALQNIFNSSNNIMFEDEYSQIQTDNMATNQRFPFQSSQVSNNNNYTTTNQVLHNDCSRVSKRTLEDDPCLESHTPQLFRDECASTNNGGQPLTSHISYDKPAKRPRLYDRANRQIVSISVEESNPTQNGLHQPNDEWNALCNGSWSSAL